MYGPPVSPAQKTVDASILAAPEAWGLSVLVGLVLCALAVWRRPPEAARVLALCLGMVAILTAPLVGSVQRWVYGAFPTIDKAGSLRFYLEGVHRTMLADPLGSVDYPPARLIGVHVGHLWVTEVLDLFVSAVGAFNLQAWLYPALGWWAAWLLCREVHSSGRGAIIAAFPFGMGLRVFVDLNWYTIEKAAVFWLPLFCWAALRGVRCGGGWAPMAGLVYVAMAWNNLYLGMLGALVGVCTVLWSLRQRQLLLRVAVVCVWCVGLSLPLVLWQAALLSSGPQLATPEVFLWHRAALDGVGLWPPTWARIELWRALDPLVVVGAAVGAWQLWAQRWTRGLLAGAGVCAVLALGPAIVAEPLVKNPVYLLLVEVVPGFWRVAKPEVFFVGPWLAAVILAARGIAPWVATRRGLGACAAAVLGAWVLQARLHPAYPGFSEPIEMKAVEGWEKRVFPTGEDKAE